MKSRRVLSSIGLLIVFVTMLGCAEQEITTAPKPTLAQPKMGSLESFSNFLDAEGGDTLGLPAYLYTDYPEGIKVVLTVSGKIHAWSDPDSSDYFGTTVDAGPGGIWIDGGLGFCAIGVTITFGGAVFGPPPCVPYDTSGAWSITAVVSGNGKAKRNPGIPSYSGSVCERYVCHTYTGQQTITVAPLAGDLDLQARYLLENRTVRKALFIHPFINSDTYAHQMVHFTDSTTPRGLPIKALFNTWTMMDPSAPPGYWQHTQPSCTMSNPLNTLCAVDVRETGIFKATARVNGVEHSDDLTVYCAESDSLLNNDLVRQQMLAVLDSSQYTDPEQTHRKEQGFLVVLDTVTPGAQPYLLILPKDPSANVCDANPALPSAQSLPPNTRVLAWGHDHPSEPNIYVACRDDTGRLFITTTSNGASTDDWEAADTLNNFGVQTWPAAWFPMPGYIIDKHNVFILRPGQSIHQERDLGNMFNWDGLTPRDTTVYARRCGWPKRIVQ